MSSAGRGVTPGAEPDAGSGRDAGSPDRGETVSSATGPETGGRAGEPADGVPGPDAAQAPDGKDGKDGKATPGSGSSAGGTGRGTATRRSSGGRFLRELVILIVVALVIAVVIKTFAIQAFFIPSGSMENTLEINDRVLVNKIVYHTRSIHRGDIVVFNGDGSWAPGSVPKNSNVAEEFFSGFASMFGFGTPGDILIKRVIGLPGDQVACCDAQGRVTVNGIPLNEQSYLYPGDVPSQIRFNIVVPPGRLWVMGDNRSISDDSRDHRGDPGGGTVPESAVIGRAFVIIWPPSRWRILPIPATFEQPKLNESSAATPAGTTAGSASTAGLLSARLEPSNPALPLSLGFAVAVPVSWLQRRVRVRRTRRRAAARCRAVGHVPG
ncbi:MAG TPA: signal peptidase I, partial [Streptosporangiaceae bacterium]|nr:signal peptidase I [Streptosporangiaceae bacterium]